MRITSSLIYRICLVLVLCGGVGCAARGDVAQLRKDLQKDLAETHLRLHERLEQALGDMRQRLETVTAVQAKLKDIQASKDQHDQALATLHQKMRVIEASQQAVNETKNELEGLQKEKARLQGILNALETTLLRTLKSEQVELKDRLKLLDNSVKDLEHMSVSAN
jgi:DNA repair exonuclease SbcCD ATPase subunit